MTPEELLSYREAYDFEAKAAQGRDGDGAVPGSIWPTYSAFANTQGGYILLGAAERDDGTLDFVGLGDMERVRRDFWNGVNNTQLVNVNLLENDDVRVVEIEGRQLLLVHVPRAPRKRRPVHTGDNPFTGTYRRGHEGDYRCDDATVRRMIAEAEADDRDARLLEGYTLEDIDADSLAAFRNDFKSTRPGHPWLAQDDQMLLQSLGGWRRDRQTGEEGLTLAGLLMFGKLASILEAVPHYLVDYQEREGSDADPDTRWTDRVTTDGTWSGNLYGFYRRVYPRLTSGLRVPFRLEHGHKRVDESHVHEALREALVNTLIHADYAGSTGILVIKKPDRFIFRNPGGLRIPLEQVFDGGNSDCRNRNLQKMFQMIGAAEQAGSGFPKILRAWREKHWRKPLLRESFDPEFTVLELSMMSLIPQEAIAQLQELYAGVFDHLPEIQRLALATALIEGKVTNHRLRELSDEHPRDLTRWLRELVDRGLLLSDGTGRGTYYSLAQDGDEIEPKPREESLSLFDWNSTHSTGALVYTTPSEPPSIDSEGSSTHPAESSTHSEGGSTQEEQDVEQDERLRAIAKPVSTRKTAPRKLVRRTILELCTGRYLTLQELADLLNRDPRTLRTHYIPELVSEGRLEQKYPTKSDPRQAYRTRDEESYE
ncbi:MAG: ATP-binding protein [Rhodothermales bacterium]